MQLTISIAFLIIAGDCISNALDWTSQSIFSEQANWVWWIVGFVWFFNSIYIWFFKLERK